MNAINCNDPFLTFNQASGPSMKLGTDLGTDRLTSRDSSPVPLHSRLALPPPSLPAGKSESRPKTLLSWADGDFLYTMKQGISFVLKIFHLASMLVLSAGHSAVRRAPCAKDPGGTMAKCFLRFFPLPWIQSMTFTSGIPTGHLSDSLVGK